MRPRGGRRILEGISVLDFTWAMAGPYGVMILADLGAEVRKIETPLQTGGGAGMEPYVHSVSTYFFSVNRGKKSIMLDLKAPEATEVEHRTSSRWIRGSRRTRCGRSTTSNCSR